MVQLVKALYHPNIQAVEYVADDGRHLIRSGGSLPWRTCNMGDLASPVTNGVPTPKKTKGFIGFANPADSGYHFFIFPDHETGRRELRASLLRQHKNKTISKMVEAYAPRKDKANDTDRYISDLCRLSGVGESEIIKDLSEKQLNAVMDAIARIEGFHANEATRKEIWVDVSHIQATDGTRPVADQEIVARIDGKDVTLKSNAVGRFPPIAHTQNAVELHQKSADGELKKIGEIKPGKSQRFNLRTKSEYHVGKTLPRQPLGSTIDRKQPFLHIVQPGEDVVSIGGLIGSPADEIRKNNQLKKSVVFQGQALWLHAPSPSGRKLPRTKAKKAAPIAKSVKPKNSTDGVSASAGSKPYVDPLKKDLAITTAQARSKKGKGEALALMTPQEGVAPWMKYALEEAKYFKGADEAIIQKTKSYHTLIHDGKSKLAGDSNAWCAAFVNWCLMQSGYPIENPEESKFVDRDAAKGRAHGFIQVKGQKANPKQSVDEVKLVPNPLFRIIDEPVYGAIAIVTKRSGHGHHAALVYGRIDANNLCLLGGNQSNAITFMSQNIKAEPARVVERGGKKEEVPAKTDHLTFLLPVAYTNPASNGPDQLQIQNPYKLNKEFKIEVHRAEATSFT